MSVKHLTPSIISRTVHVIDSSGIVDMLVPPREPGQVGRVGSKRENMRLLMIGLRLCTVLGHETTIMGVYDTLTQALPRDVQWDLGVLRPLTTDGSGQGGAFDPDAPTLVVAGKPRKRRWPEDGVEMIGYDDLHNASADVRKRFDYGVRSAPKLRSEVRLARKAVVCAVKDALIDATTIQRKGSAFAVDGTGQWAWRRGLAKLAKKLKQASKERRKEGKPGDPNALEVLAIAMTEEGKTAPANKPTPAEAATGMLEDADWGYRTGKDGQREVGFGFHLHTAVSVPDANADQNDEPVLVYDFAITPASADPVAETLDLLDNISRRHKITRVIGDLLYTNFTADRWAVPLADRGIDQVIMMRSDNHGVVDVLGAQMQHGWLHCPAAPMNDRPVPPSSPLEECDWDALHHAVEDFRYAWAFDRKESGLGASQTSKWICPATCGRSGCHARGADNVLAATRQGLPVITPPSDWQTRDCCTKKTIDFTPNATEPSHQRKLMQRFYYGTAKHRAWYKRRTYVEGVFGILKNPSRQRMRRGQNRLPGLAMQMILTAIKISVFNEEQLRAWHDLTGKGPADHPLLQPDPAYHGWIDLTREQAKLMDAQRLAELKASVQPAA